MLSTCSHLAGGVGPTWRRPLGFGTSTFSVLQMGRILPAKGLKNMGEGEGGQQPHLVSTPLSSRRHGISAPVLPRCTCPPAPKPSGPAFPLEDAPRPGTQAGALSMALAEA